MPPVVPNLFRRSLAAAIVEVAVLCGLVLLTGKASAQTPVPAPVPGDSTYLPRTNSPGPGTDSPSRAPLSNTVAAEQPSASTTPPVRPLPPRSTDAKNGPLDALSSDGRRQPGGPLSSLTTVFCGLVIVIGLFLVVAWLFKRSMPKGAGSLPTEVVEVLGQTSLAPRQMVHLIRVGQKMLLVSISTAGVETLTEITDPVEVDRLAGICGQSSPHSVSSAFRHVFRQFSDEQAPSGFIGDANAQSNDLAQSAAGREVTHG